MEKAGRVERFEDLIAWQKSRALTKEIYLLTDRGKFERDLGLRDQIRKASVSVMSNIAEGFERSARAQFHQFLVIAKASCAEVRSQLYVALDARYLSEQEFQKVLHQASEVARIIGGLRSSVERSKG